MDRRSLIGLGTTALAGLSLRATASSSGASTQNVGTEIVLWPDVPPGGNGVNLKLEIENRGFWPNQTNDLALSRIEQSTLSVFRSDRGDGSALLIVPGGGYRHLLVDKEGSEVARRFNAAGITSFVLTHRLPSEGWANGRDVPLQDAQRAMRLMRKRAPEFGVDPKRIGVLGFSAGGHVAASLMTRFDAAVYAPVDDADRNDARPDFAGLVYPVISMSPPLAHVASREELLGAAPTGAEEAAYSCDRLVSGKTAPGFLIAAADDRDVDPMNSVAMFQAMRAASVASELHLFEEGGHGFSLRRIEGRPVSVWPELFLHWGGRRGAFRAVGY
jgi:acetyl esterase/lipase